MRTHEERKRIAKLTVTVAEQATEHEMRHCVHFNGVMNKCCKAGVSYDAVMDRNLVYPAERMACFVNGPDLCEQRRFPTREEAEEKGRAAEESIGRCVKAIVAVKEHAAGRRGIQCVVECPNCGGKLHYSISAYNGHSRGFCQTTDCANWIE